MVHKRGRAARWAKVLIVVVLAATLTAVAAFAASSLKKGQTIYFIPKDTLNPYEVIADTAASSG